MTKKRRRAKGLPPAALLLTLFRYDWRSGVLRRADGRPCGRKVSIGNVDYWAARVCWKMRTGRDPAGVVDFRDRDPANLRWRNLRDVTPSAQRLLARPPARGSTGAPGVTRVAPGRYRARVHRNGRAVHLGYFGSVAAARAARRQAVRELLTAAQE